MMAETAAATYINSKDSGYGDYKALSTGYPF